MHAGAERCSDRAGSGHYDTLILLTLTGQSVCQPLCGSIYMLYGHISRLATPLPWRSVYTYIIWHIYLYSGYAGCVPTYAGWLTESTYNMTFLPLELHWTTLLFVKIAAYMLTLRLQFQLLLLAFMLLSSSLHKLWYSPGGYWDYISGFVRCLPTIISTRFSVLRYEQLCAAFNFVSSTVLIYVEHYTNSCYTPDMILRLYTPDLIHYFRI